MAAFLEVKVPGLSLQSMLVQQVQQVGNGIFPRWDEKFLERSGDLHVFFEKIEGSDGLLGTLDSIFFTP